MANLQQNDIMDQKIDQNADTAEVVLDSYELTANGLPVSIKIVDRGEFAPTYEVTVPGIGQATKLLLLSLRQELLNLVPFDLNKMDNKEYIDELTVKYGKASDLLINKYLPRTDDKSKDLLKAYIINIMVGLGELEATLADQKLEEIAVNSGNTEVWVFHSEFGWCKTNMILGSESLVYNDAEQIGRRVGRQISNLSPIMDAKLIDGSRVNATLFPISQSGNTLTIRKFAKNPWTVTSLMANKTCPSNIAALIWLCMQNELSLMISGGTASGKTSFLNAISTFIPASRRVISLEETRELTLPSFLQWLPMLTRQPNAEGKGEITLYDLMINALRQRPDVILVGEMRTKKDAEMLFEAIHTGHAVYGTLHADDVEDTVLRMTNEPIAIPKIVLNALAGIVTLFRYRKVGVRRVLEMGEMQRSGDANVLYRWNLRKDTFLRVSASGRLYEIFEQYAGLTGNEVEDDIKEKGEILEWMVRNKIFGVDDVSYIVSSYYKSKDRVVQLVKDDAQFKDTFLYRGPK